MENEQFKIEDLVYRKVLESGEKGIVQMFLVDDIKKVMQNVTSQMVSRAVISLTQKGKIKREMTKVKDNKGSSIITNNLVVTIKR